MTMIMSMGMSLTLTALPDDVLYVIFSCCDRKTLGRIACVCKRANYLISQDCCWLRVSKQLTLVKDYSGYSRCVRPLKEQCSTARNWLRAKGHNTKLVQYRDRQQPWLQLDVNGLWVSQRNVIHCYPRLRQRGWKKMTLRGHQRDISRFACRDDVIVSGATDGSLCWFDLTSGKPLACLSRCHDDDIHSVDFHQGGVVVSGSRDNTVKLWRLVGAEGEGGRLLHTIAAEDRVWSVAMNPTAASFVTGTAGRHGVAPLRVWDTERVVLLGVLGRGYRYGAGVQDLQYSSPHSLLSCGYDQQIRLWDLRLTHRRCVMQWEEPFESSIYCVKSDGGTAVLAGTARYGAVMLCDTRSPRFRQYYYTGQENSPAYSVAFDETSLYVGIDRAIHITDFSGAKSQPLSRPPTSTASQ